MSVHADVLTKNLLDRFLVWWRAVREGGGIDALDASERERIAREYGLSGEELARIDHSGGRAADLLHRMMRANGLSYEDVRQTHPDVVRDLEIHCSLCSEKRRCRRELESGAAPEGFTEYCPNAPTMVELQAVSLQRLV
jgi:hypothetical protein